MKNKKKTQEILITSGFTLPSGVVVSEELVTPDIAADWLKKNISNRPIRQKSVKRYSETMQAAQWMLNHEPIIFDTDGNLLNGQHRLMAVVASKSTVMASIVRNASKDIYPTLDCGSTRTAADALALAGYKYYYTLGPAVKVILRLKRSDTYVSTITCQGGNAATSAKEVLDYCKNHPSIEEDARICLTKYPRVVQLLSGSAAVAIFHLFREKDPKLCEEFFQKLTAPTLLQEDHVLMQLFMKLSDMRRALITDRLQTNMSFKIGLCISAWNYLRDGVYNVNLIVKKTGYVEEIK